MFKRILVLVFAVLLSATFWGCSSNRDSSDRQVTGDELGNDPVTGVAFVGATTCIGCHEGFSWSSQEVADYLAGEHVIHSEHIAADADPECLGCHDPIGDGPALESLIDEADVPAGGLAAVGCENCHGAGGDHFGVGPIPVSRPSIDECGKCHGALPESHLAFHPEADNIAPNFKLSQHFDASLRNSPICSRCHTDEGAKLYKDVTTRDQLMTVVLSVESNEKIQCRTCHNPHNAGGLLFEDVESRGNVIATAEYATCTSCHMSDKAAVVASEDVDEDGNLLPDFDQTELMYHETVYYRVLTDTHYDDPETTDTIEGYVVDPLSDRACRDCHNIHTVEEIRADDDSRNFSNTINDQWSKSAHGGFIGEIKLAVAEFYGDALDDVPPGLDKNRTIEQMIAIKEAGVTDEEAAAWSHYDWDATTEFDVDDGIVNDRASCQMCHTATGAKNFLSDPENYDPLNNDFSHLDGWDLDGGPNGETVSSGQNELLYCWGCHSDNAGGLRNPGAIPRPYAVGGTQVVIPDIGNSNICVNCHGARGNMEEYELAEDPATDMSALAPGFGPGTKNVTEAHYLVAAATLFSEDTRIGYEYAGQDYSNVGFFGHDGIGLNEDDPESGAGPCVRCHMEVDEDSHLFKVVDKDADGVITAIRTQATCNECHADPFVMDAEILEEEAEGYHEALDILEVALADNGVIFTAGYPYFSADSWVNEGIFGAAHNFNYLHHEPGGYAHNRFYVKRLIFDSVDWLDNGVLDDTITIDAVTYPEAAVWFGADEVTGDATRPGDPVPDPDPLDGAALYAAGNCANCHGADGSGGSQANIQNYTLIQLQAAPGGVGAHATIGTWTDAEANAVVDFLAVP